MNNKSSKWRVSAGGKGDRDRTTDKAAADAGYEGVFGKRVPWYESRDMSWLEDGGEDEQARSIEHDH